MALTHNMMSLWHSHLFYRALLPPFPPDSFLDSRCWIGTAIVNDRYAIVIDDSRKWCYKLVQRVIYMLEVTKVIC